MVELFGGAQQKKQSYDNYARGYEKIQHADLGLVLLFFAGFRKVVEFMAILASAAGANVALWSVLSKAFSESEEGHDKDDRNDNNVRYHLDSL